jgi:hypothetical protein
MRYCPHCFKPSPDEQAHCACGVDLDARGISFGLRTGEGPAGRSPRLMLAGIGSGAYWLLLLNEMHRPGHRDGSGHQLAGLLLLISIPMLAVSAVTTVTALARLRENPDPGAIAGLAGGLIAPLIVIGSVLAS